jgi:hypothetical protein
MRQWKIALSVAIVGAAVAPFVLGSYKLSVEREYVVAPLTAEEKEQIAAKLKKNNYCQEQRDRLAQSHDINDTMPVVACDLEVKTLERGETLHSYSRMAKYLAINAAVVIASFAVIFGLTYLLPALARRYWKWLNA